MTKSKNPATTLVSTVGTSLFKPNLETIAKADPGSTLAKAYRDLDGRAIAQGLAEFDPAQRECGAEINSIHSLRKKNFIAPDANLFFCHSATPDGRAIAMTLENYYRNAGVSRVGSREIEGLQDERPEEFRRLGLRMLAREICEILRSHDPGSCAINATGGYKAQIAIAVLMGQAIGVPVYYKHERFDEIVPFPPMPVSLDMDIWLKCSPMFYDLGRTTEPVAVALWREELGSPLDERMETLLDRVEIDGTEFVGLTPTGQIFHETFRERFRQQASRSLPRAAQGSEKREPHLEQAGWPGEHPDVERFMRAVTAEVSFVCRCSTIYFNPDLGARCCFRLSTKGIEGIYPSGGATVKFRVDTTAVSQDEKLAAVAKLNEWLASR